MLLWIVMCDLYLFHFTVLLNPDFNCSKSFLSFSFDKVTIGTYNFVSVIQNVAFFGWVIAGLFPCATNTTALCVKTQLLDRVKAKDTLQLISGILKLLQKMLKSFNGTTVSASVIVLLLLLAVFPVILVLYLKDSEFLMPSLSGSSL